MMFSRVHSGTTTSVQEDHICYFFEVDGRCCAHLLSLPQQIWELDTTYATVTGLNLFGYTEQNHSTLGTVYLNTQAIIRIDNTTVYFFNGVSVTLDTTHAQLLTDIGTAQTVTGTGITSVNGDTGPVVILDTGDIASVLNKRYVTDAQLTVLSNTSGTNSGDETAASIGALINGSTAATPNDTDLIATAESSVLKKLT